MNKLLLLSFVVVVFVACCVQQTVAEDKKPPALDAQKIVSGLGDALKGIVGKVGTAVKTAAPGVIKKLNEVLDKKDQLVDGAVKLFDGIKLKVDKADIQKVVDCIVAFAKKILALVKV